MGAQILINWIKMFVFIEIFYKTTAGLFRKLLDTPLFAGAVHWKIWFNVNRHLNMCKEMTKLKCYVIYTLTCSHDQSFLGKIKILNNFIWIKQVTIASDLYNCLMNYRKKLQVINQYSSLKNQKTYSIHILSFLFYV